MISAEPDVGGPAVLDPSNPEVVAALAALAAHHEGPRRGEGPPEPPRADLYAHPDVVAALTEVFHGKCGYCETPLTPIGASNVDHFRPTGDAIGLDGAIDHPAYWWQSYAWENLVLACHDCIRTKGSRFPVVGTRATNAAELASEEPLLLNPRDPRDAPDGLLIFADDGTVSAADKRGRVTIDVLGLGRARLVAARRDVASEVRAALRSPATRGAPALGADLPYLGLRRQLWATGTKDASLTAAPIATTTRKLTKTRFDVRQQSKSANSLSDNVGSLGSSARYDYYSGTRFIERIEVRNVRPVRSVNLDLSSSDAVTAPWTMLLGDNGSGKSSILQAVALALVGAEYRARLGVRPDDLLRRGARSGSVRIWFTNLADPVVLEFAKGASDFTGTAVPKVLVLAFGATRLRAADEATSSPSDVSHVDNLFDARHELTNPNAWLLSLPDDTFDTVTASLHGLLALEPHVRIVRSRRNDQVYLQYGRQRDPFRDLSDGYQSMLVLTCEVMRTMMSLWPSPRLAEGIVLLDEIGTHLHPRWKMRITSALRAVLPRVQFLVSTHEPLCLRGLEDGEITVINRNDAGQVVTIIPEESVRGLRVDQLLTSEIFGLGSTQDPALDALYEEYYALRGVAAPSPEQRQRLGELEDELNRLRQLGVTQRERMMLVTADQIIADRRAKGDVKARQELSASLASLWTQA